MEKRKGECKEEISARCGDAQTKFLIPSLLGF